MAHNEDPADLEAEITALWHRAQAGDVTTPLVEQEKTTLDAFVAALETGTIRAAEQTDEGWATNTWVKQGILLNFELRETVRREYGDVGYYDVLPLQDTSTFEKRGIRNTPDGTTVRQGAYLGPDTIMMSPSFVNIGAHVGAGTLVDSATTVGSCAQIGQNVKLGANTLIGGVLEPVENTPVIIEDDVTLGAGCRVTSGFVIGEQSVVGENTLLTPRIPVYDLVAEEIIYGRLPPERRAFQRYVKSSVSDHDLIDGAAYKPAVVATDLKDRTMEATQREELLRE